MAAELWGHRGLRSRGRTGGSWERDEHPDVPHGVPCPQERDLCVCCQTRSEPPPASCSRHSEMLTMYPNPDCRSIRVALKVGDAGGARGSSNVMATAHPAPPQDLLFSVCGLTVFSTIVCTLSAVVCCIQIFSLDIVHVVRPSPGPAADGMGVALGCQGRTWPKTACG